MENIKEILNQQLADDFCCSVNEVKNHQHIFTYYEPRMNRRKYNDDNTCFLKIACIHGKLLVSGEKSIVDWCREKYHNSDAAWFMEYDNLYELDCKMHEYGYRVGLAHPFYISDEITQQPDIKGDIVWYEENEIERFRGDLRFHEAFAFCQSAPDRIGVSLQREGQILGMAGASSDSMKMWQIGIDVLSEYRGEHIGTALVILLKNELLKRGILPFYGTAMSHIASQNVAFHAGFYPAWTELYVQKN